MIGLPTHCFVPIDGRPFGDRWFLQGAESCLLSVTPMRKGLEGGPS